MSTPGEQIDRDFSEVEAWAARLKVDLEAWAASMKATLEEWAAQVVDYSETDHDARIAELEFQVADLEARITALGG